jgi:multidrug efflux pump subunit AcrB
MMKLPFLAIRNYQFVLVFIGLLTLVGVMALLTMPRSEDPNPSFPNYTITVIYPGSTPEDLEELVVDPLEAQLDEVDEIDQIRTTIEEGVVVINVEAFFGIEADDKKEDIEAAVNNARSDLPSGILEVKVEQFKPEERVSIRQYALTSSTAGYDELLDAAEALEDVLENVQGVKTTEILAYPREEIRVALDLEQMARRNIPLAQVYQILAGNNRLLPGGDIPAGDRSFNVQGSGSYKDLEQIANTVVGGSGHHLVYLRDIARVRMDHEDVRWRARHNGVRAVYLNLKRRAGVNQIAVDERVREAADRFSASQMPPSIRLQTAFEQASAVSQRISGFFVNLLQGIVLVGVVILLFLGFRSSVIVMTVIPLSIVLALGALDQLGFGLQQISIAALVIALGLLVDNGIVVIENIARFRKEGYGLLEAAAKGTGEVGYAIVSSTVTTLLAFFPLALWESGPGEFLRSLPVTVILVLTFSLLLALTFTPIFASRIYSKQQAPRPTGMERRLRRLAERAYLPLLRFALRKPWAILVTALVLLAGAVALFPSIGVSFFPTADKPLLLIEVDAPDGSSLDRTGKAVRYVERTLDTMDYVDHYTANVGHGNPMVYYNRIPESYAKNHGQLLVHFTEWDKERFYRSLGRMRTQFARYPDARITFRELKNGPPFEAPIAIRIIGPDLDTLRKYSFGLEQAIASTEGVINVDNPLATPKTDLKVDINRDKAAMMGVQLADIDLALRSALSGVKVDEVTLPDGEAYPLVLRLPTRGEPRPSDLDRVWVHNQEGALIPLSELASLRFEPTTSQILHFNLERNVTVTAGLTQADKTTAITEEIIAKLEEYPLPEGYRYYVAGEYETQQESFGDLGSLLLIAMVGIFAVLVLQFRSFSQPLIVFSAIPLAVTGSFVALFLTGWSFSFFAFVGFISLVGIVVNNSIILVDYTNQLLAEERALEDALESACRTRFVPIVLTTVTTILGLLPLTLQQSTQWSPLGWTMIGGMISSSLLTLLVVPILYRFFTKAPKEATA